jgi:tetratricopeptide (TPR) repeat protein
MRRAFRFRRALARGIVLGSALLLIGCAADRQLDLNAERTRAFEVFAMGEEYERAGRFERALDAYTEALSISERPAFYYKAGTMHHALGRPARAVYFYDRALETAPDYDLASARRELALLQLREMELADGQAIEGSGEGSAVEVAQTLPGLQPPRAARGETATAATTFEQIAPDDVRAAIFPELSTTGSNALEAERTRAREASEAGRWTDAVLAWSRVVREEPGDAEARLALARAYEQTGRPRRAFQEYAAAAEAAPQDPEVLIRWGNALASAGLLYDAEVRYRDALQIVPDSSRALSNLAAVQMELGFPERAIADLKAVTEAQPEFAPGWLNLALALEMTGGDPAETAEAVEAYLRAGGLREMEAEAWLLRLREQTAKIENPAESGESVSEVRERGNSSQS